MALSDCVDCWDTPCTCGSDYQSWTQERLLKQIEMLQRVLSRKRALDPNRNIDDYWDTSRPGNR